MSYTPGPLEEGIMRSTLEQEIDRLVDYANASLAYDGDFPDPLTVAEGEPRDIVIVNRIRPIVDASTFFLFGTPPSVELPKLQVEVEEPIPEEELAMQAAQQGAGAGDDEGEDDDEAGEPGQAKPKAPAPEQPTTRTVIKEEQDPAEKWLHDCLRANNWESVLLDIAINGAKSGTPYYGIDTNDLIDNPEDPQKPFPEFYAIDPACMRIRCAPRNIKRVWAYIWEYNSYDRVAKKPTVERVLYEREESGTWLITEQKAYIGTDQKNFSMSTDRYALNWITVAETPWPYQWPPVGHTKNLPNPNEVYGRPDVTDTLIDNNKALNFNLTNRQRIDKFHGHPIVYIIGYNGDLRQLDTSIGGIINIPEDRTKVEVGQLVPSVDGQAAANLGREIYEAMLEESGTPSIVLGRSDGQDSNPSGVALRVKMGPLIMKTEVKRILYAPLLVELCRRLLQLGGWGENRIVTLNWPDLVPTNPQEEREVARIDKELGASDDTILGKLGYDPEVEREKRKMNAATMGEAMLQAFDRGQMGGGFGDGPGAGDEE